MGGEAHTRWHLVGCLGLQKPVCHSVDTDFSQGRSSTYGSALIRVSRQLLLLRWHAWGSWIVWGRLDLTLCD